MNESKKKVEQKGKLVLNRETLRVLETKELHLIEGVVGGTGGGMFTFTVGGGAELSASCRLCQEN
jgi:hypothetical protein